MTGTGQSFWPFRASTNEAKIATLREMPVAPGEAREQDGSFVVTAVVQDGELRVLHREEIAVPLEMIARARSRRETLIEAMHRFAMERAYFHAERLRKERPEEGI